MRLNVVDVAGDFSLSVSVNEIAMMEHQMPFGIVW
jgi:hypothetical protein